MRDRRKNIRFKANETLFIVSPSRSYGRVNDISRGGMAFHYVNWNKDDCSDCSLDIMLLDGKKLAEALPFEVVSEKLTTENSSTPGQIVKKRRVRFSNLNPDQYSMVQQIIQEHTDDLVANGSNPN